jgi:hypothetical protein
MYAFQGCTALPEVSFSVALSVGAYAFQSCTALSRVSMPVVKAIQSYTFYGCTALTEAVFPRAASVGSSAFFSCSALAMVSLPSAVSIYSCAFQRCVNLVSLYLMGPVMCALAASSVFSSTPIGGYSDVAGQFGTIYVPESLYSSYVRANGWYYLSSRIVSVPAEGT